MSKTELLRELVFRHAPAEIKAKIRSLETIDGRINVLKAERRAMFKDLLGPLHTEEPCIPARNGDAVPF